MKRYVILIALLFAGAAYAGGDRVTQSNDMNNQTAGDVIQAQGDIIQDGGAVTASPSYENRTLALALSNNLGGVDIGDCLASNQWATPIFSKQKFDLNRWCAAMWYDSNGMHAAAARMRCKLKEVRSMYDDPEACIAENTVRTIAPPPPAAEVEDEDLIELEEEISLTQKKLDAALMQIAAVAEATEQKPAAQIAPQQIINEVEFLNDSKRAALEELRKAL